MKMILVLPFIIGSMLYACKPTDTNKPEDPNNMIDTSQAPVKIMIPNATCYAYVSGRDTFRLKVEKFENVTTGTLSYLFSEKDQSKGHLDGKMYGDTLRAIYTYYAEGTVSKREVAFLVTDDMALEGYGSLKEENGIMRFTSPGDIKFGDGLKLQKTDCTQFANEKIKLMTAAQQGLSGMWELNYLSGTSVAIEKLYPGKRPMLKFASQIPTDFNGHTGCNSLHGKCVVQASKITFAEPMAMTKMACQGNGEAAYVDMLKRVNRYDIEKNVLHLRIDDLEVMRFIKK